MASVVRALKRLVGSSKKMAGTDLHGNEYYEVSAQGGRRPKRYMKPMGMLKAEQYTPDAIPVEWERWLRWLRDDPPLHKELQWGQQRLHRVQRKAREVEEKDQKLREHEAKAEGLATASRKVKDVGHASAPSVGMRNPTEEPTSDGKSFEPESWRPMKK